MAIGIDYDYAKSPDPAFIEQNLGDEALASLGMSFVLITDRQGTILYSRSSAADHVLPVELTRQLAA